MDFKTIQVQLQADLEISSDNIQNKSMELSKIYQKYLDLYFSEIKTLQEFQESRNKKFAEIFHKIRTEGYQGYDVGKTKNETEIYINLDPDYQKINKQFLDQELIVKYLEKSLENINKAGFSIKNYVDLQKLKQGIM